MNVLSTGVLTIPMMIKRGFSKVFAGGMEAAAFGWINHAPCDGRCGLCFGGNDGGAVSRGDYCRSLARAGLFPLPIPQRIVPIAKQGIEAFGEFTEDMRISRIELLHLCQIALPILLILLLLLTPKDLVGCGFFGWITGADVVMQGDRCCVSNLNWGMQIFQNAAGTQGPRDGGPRPW